MSFIRCLSNPEGLYIWHDVSKVICITGGSVPPGIIWEVPLKDWYAILRQHSKNHGWIPSRGIKRGVLRLWENEDNKIVLTTPYGDVTMWEVTWEYITRRR